jgi:hypothetical protein
VPGKFAKGTRFLLILGALLLYDLKTHERIEPIEAKPLFQGAARMTGR